jgi:hypothetical protein
VVARKKGNALKKSDHEGDAGTAYLPFGLGRRGWSYRDEAIWIKFQ